MPHCSKTVRRDRVFHWGKPQPVLWRGWRPCDNGRLSNRQTDADVTPLVQTFVSHFGEMGSRWGINRTVGQIYALLFVSNQPLHADDISEKLSISRSNVSIGLKELQSWGLVRLSRVPGDRREYFTSLGDVWEIFRVVAAERRRREVAPTLSVLRESLLVSAKTDEDIFAQQRMREMHELVDLANTWFDDMQRLSPESLSQLMRMGTTVQKLLSAKDKLFGAGPSLDEPAP
ncbi:MAG: GbsR/MarR family transcriptional regulator [Burkholderiaceae bacterium]|nr:GbsR/MarR family transcriptional regulator [Burkholderiaceae bacterium]